MHDEIDNTLILTAIQKMSAETASGCCDWQGPKRHDEEPVFWVTPSLCIVVMDYLLACDNHRMRYRQTCSRRQCVSIVHRTRISDNDPLALTWNEEIQRKKISKERVDLRKKIDKIMNGLDECDEFRQS